MSEPVPQTGATKHKLRWYQFSLQSLLLFVTVFGVSLGWIGSLVKRIHDQRVIVRRIESRGGHVVLT